MTKFEEEFAFVRATELNAEPSDGVEFAGWGMRSWTGVCTDGVLVGKEIPCKRIPGFWMAIAVTSGATFFGR
jgi:hypothetical protein